MYVTKQDGITLNLIFANGYQQIAKAEGSHSVTTPCCVLDNQKFVTMFHIVLIDQMKLVVPVQVR